MDLSKIDRDRAKALPALVTEKFAALPQVRAVALAGSRTGSNNDTLSDFDIYIYADEEIPAEVRREIARGFAQRMEIDNRLFEPGDEWIDEQSNIAVDLIYRSPEWIEDQLDRVLVRHEASLGYSTCLWYNILHSEPLFDRTGWFSALQAKANQRYPTKLMHAIILKNYPLLRRNISSYTHQIEKAVERNDLVSVQHRLTALLASYFDIIFALNRQPHPGEKRLLVYARELCTRVPPNMEADVNALLLSAPTKELIALVHKLLDDLDRYLENLPKDQGGELRPSYQ